MTNKNVIFIVIFMPKMPQKGIKRTNTINSSDNNSSVETLDKKENDRVINIDNRIEQMERCTTIISNEFDTRNSNLNLIKFPQN